MWFWNFASWRRRHNGPALTLAGLRVLLVEDAFDWHRPNLHALEAAGASVDLECAWQSAFDLLDRRPDDYDAVVFDLDLPLPDQVKTVRRLRHRGISALILGLTARDDQEVERHRRSSGCDAVLRLPIDRCDVTSPVSLIAG
ncbi:MAG TPA: hypothetical protein VGN57_06660 [Pirellulaceae bacterium]|jgi:DNA-binding response OmpR family regulator|nr:hypothetical protein [Pirellulaceae bacterium]